MKQSPLGEAHAKYLLNARHTVGAQLPIAVGVCPQDFPWNPPSSPTPELHGRPGPPLQTAPRKCLHAQLPRAQAPVHNLESGAVLWPQEKLKAQQLL